jgi:hypothetical protein
MCFACFNTVDKFLVPIDEFVWCFDQNALKGLKMDLMVGFC